MPRVFTKYFESLDYQEDDLIRFPSGLPAFEEEVLFLLIEPLDRAPLVFLQSISRPALCFLTLPILAIDPGYALSITLEDLESLELPTNRQPVIGEEVHCLAVIAIGDGATPSANMLAPIVINRANRVGVQAIRVDATYSHHHSVGKAEDACS